MNKRQLLNQLEQDVYCRLGCSKVCDGVGVFAVRTIPEETDVFRNCDTSRYVKIRKQELEARSIDPEVLRLVTDLCVFDGEHFLLPSKGVQAIDMSYYVNHSDNPNLRVKGRGHIFVASRVIDKGEELTADYNTYDELRESYRPRRGKNEE